MIRERLNIMLQTRCSFGYSTTGNINHMQDFLKFIYHKLLVFQVANRSSVNFVKVVTFVDVLPLRRVLTKCEQ